MRDQLVELFHLEHVRTTKWNEAWYSPTHVFIFNAATGECKIRERKNGLDIADYIIKQWKN